jgi:hypothetical protein
MISQVWRPNPDILLSGLVAWGMGRDGRLAPLSDVFHSHAPSTRGAVIPAKAGIHLALVQGQNGFPLSRE